MPRVLIHVNGGVASYQADPGVEVEVLDWDCIGDGEHGLSFDAVLSIIERFNGMITDEEAEELLLAVAQHGEQG